ncbi:hypothetical protein ACVXG9_12545 [Escherichia coli]
MIIDLASLRARQIELASSVIREDRLDKDPTGSDRRSRCRV